MREPTSPGWAEEQKPTPFLYHKLTWNKLLTAESGVFVSKKGCKMFTNFSGAQKDLFWEVIQELPINFDDSKVEDIAYLEMKIDNGQPLNKENQKALRHSTLLLRLLKEVLKWKCESYTQEGDNEELNKKKDELLEKLLAAEQRKKETKSIKE